MTTSTKNYIRAFCMTLLLLVSAGARSAFAQDPGTPGPLPVTREEYNFGDTAFQPPGFPRGGGAARLDSLSNEPAGWSVSGDRFPAWPSRDLLQRRQRVVAVALRWRKPADP
jgi:hypothetical protein